MHIDCGHRQKPIGFQRRHIYWPGGHIGFFGFRTLTLVWLWLSTPRAQYLYIWVEAYWFSATSISKWPPGGILDFSVTGLCKLHVFQSVTRIFALKFQFQILCACCLLAMGRSLLIFSNVTFKMAAWWPCWILRFPDSKFGLALIWSPKFSNLCVWIVAYPFSAMWLSKWPPGGHIRLFGLQILTLVRLGTSDLNVSEILSVCMAINFSDVTFKMAAWQLYWIFWFLD